MKIYISTVWYQLREREQAQVMETIKALQAVKQQLGLGRSLGMTMSHGLPAREYDLCLLAMAWVSGLDLPIMNPFDDRVRDVTWAAAVLMNLDRGPKPTSLIISTGRRQHHRRYAHRICKQCNIPELLQDARPVKQADSHKSGALSALAQAVLEGDQHNIQALLDEALKKRRCPENNQPGPDSGY